MKGGNATIETLQLGDYAIRNGDKILYLFERKSWKDLAASIKDGRYAEQKKRLVELNNKGEIKCFYIIEGAILCEPDKLIGRVPFSTLENAKISIMLSGLTVVQTKNAQHTMQFLEKTLQYVNKKLAQNKITVTGGMQKELKAAPKNPEDFKRAVWLAFKSINNNILANFMKYSIKELAALCVMDLAAARRIIAGFTYSASKKYIKADLLDKLVDAILNSPEEEQVKILSIFPGISAKAAEFILKQIPLIKLFQMNVAELAEIHKTEKSKIGIATANKFYKIISL